MPSPSCSPIVWAPWVVLSLLATRLLGRGYVGPVRATIYGWMTMSIYARATASLLLPSLGRFKVTPKGGADEGGLHVLESLKLLTAGAAVLFLATVARLLAAAGWVGLPAMPAFATVATSLIGAFELSVIVLVLYSLVRRRQRRGVFRFPVQVSARSHGSVHRLVDLNHHGAGLLVDDDQSIDDELVLTMGLPGLDGDVHQVTVDAVIRSIERTDDGTSRAGVEFTHVTRDDSQRILEYCHVLLPAQQAAAPDQVSGPAAAVSAKVGDAERVS